MRYLRNRYLLAAFIILSAFILRVWGLGFGLPFQLHQDEPIVVNHALAYGTGDLNPHFFIIPPFCSYLLFICYGIYFVAGKLTGVFPGAEDFALGFFRDPAAFYLIARVVLGVIPGVLTVCLVYLLYKRLFSEKGAWYAAAIVAFSFLTVVNAHYAYVDNMMVFLVLAVYLSLAGMIRRPSLKNYLLSGLLTGLAVSVKYNAALLIFPCIAAHVIAVRNSGEREKSILFDKYLWAAAGASLIAFIVTNPFSVLDWRFFLDSVSGRIRTREIGWTHHITYSLYEGVGPGIMIAALLGAAAVFVKEKVPRTIFLVSFPVVFYLHLVFGSQRFSRYALPLVPFFAIAAAFFIFRVLMPAARTRLQRISVLSLACILLLPTFIKAVKADILFSGRDTRAVSAGWIEDYIAPGAKIAVDHTAYRPMIFQTEEQLAAKYEIAGREAGLNKAKEKKIGYMIRAARDRKTYNVYFLDDKSGEDVQFLSEMPVVGFDIGKLKDRGIEYVVINYNIYGGDDKFIKELGEEADVIAVFSPYTDNGIRIPYDRIDNTYMSIGSRELLSRHATGPCLVVYKIRPDGT